MELRDYRTLVGRVGTLLGEMSWKQIVDSLRQVSQERELVPRWGISLRPGILRDGMVSLLGLSDMPGLDVDFLDKFGNFEPETIEDLRFGARDLAIDLLKEQIGRGNTYFMDTEFMKETDQAVLVPGVVESRTKEIESLEPNPPLSDVYCTYYGFTVLTSGGLMRDRGGISPDTMDKLMTVLSGLGDVKLIPSKQLKFSYLSFRNCSNHQKVLLWNLLRVCLGGDKGQRAGLDILGELADSRATDLLHLRLQQSGAHGAKRHIVRALGRIGHPASLRPLEDAMAGGGYYYSRLKEEAIEAIGGIRSPSVHRHLDLGGYGRQRIAKIKAMGNTLSPRYMRELEQTVSRTREGSEMFKASTRALEKVKATKALQPDD